MDEWVTGASVARNARYWRYVLRENAGKSVQSKGFALGGKDTRRVRGAMVEGLGEVAHRFTVPIVRRRAVILRKLRTKWDWTRFGLLLIEG